MIFTQGKMRLGIVVIFLLTLVIYTAGLKGPLIFDDFPNLTQNPLLQIDGRVFDAWRTATFSAGAGALQRPVALFSFALNHAVVGEFTAYSLKAVNLGLHLVTGYFVYLFANAVFVTPAMNHMGVKRRQLAALTAMAIWLLHPLHVSTVLYAIQRMAQLSALFTVLGLWIYVKHRLEWAKRGATWVELLAVAIWLGFITALAAYSKENGLLLPWLLTVVEVALFRGVWNGARNVSLGRLGWAAFLAPLLMFAAVFFYWPEFILNGYQYRDFTLGERLMTQVHVLWQYLGWLFLPDITSMGFHHDDIALSRGLLPVGVAFYGIVAWLATLIGALLLRHRFPMFLFALLFFLVGHVFESSVFALEMVYEHRNYLPSIGICLLLSHAVSSGQLFFSKVNPALPIAGALCMLAILLFFRVGTWSDEQLLAKTNVVNHPASPRANYWYAQVLLAKAKAEQAGSSSEREVEELIVAARGYFLRTYQLSPDNSPAIVSLYITDAEYFPALVEREDWLSKLEAESEHRVMQASDYAALSKLVASFRWSELGTKKIQLGDIIDDVVRRNPNEPRALLLKYNFMVASNVVLHERIEVLEQAREIAPAHPSVQYLLIKEYGQANDLAAMYESARRWLENDPHRRALPLIRRLYVATGDSK